MQFKKVEIDNPKMKFAKTRKVRKVKKGRKARKVGKKGRKTKKGKNPIMKKLLASVLKSRKGVAKKAKSKWVRL